MKLSRSQVRDDRGSVLVAAIAVALIGIALATLVVGQAIVVTKDAGRDAARTSEIHAAEAALDATLLEIETSNPCPGPSFGEQTLHKGAQAVQLAVTIEYWDENKLPLDCGTDGQIIGTPAGARVVSTASVARPALGIAPVRRMEAELVLEPSSEINFGAALFSGGNIDWGKGFSVLQSTSGDAGDVWVNNGDVVCNNSVYIQGSLLVPQGSLDFKNANCVVKHDIWVGDGDFSINQGNSAGTTEKGNLTVANGNMNLTNKNVLINGDVTISGTFSGNGAATLVANKKTQNATIPALTPIDLPAIDFVKQDWLDKGYEVKGIADWKAILKENSVANGTWQSWMETQFDGCDMGAHYMYKGNKTYDIKIPSMTAATARPTVYDLRGCTPENKSKLWFEVNADVAFILPAWNLKSDLHFSSNNSSTEHQLFIIVPTNDNGTAPLGFAPQPIEWNSDIYVYPPLCLFVYTPGTMRLHSGGEMRGQLYAADIRMDSSSDFTFCPASIPGVNLSTTTASTAQTAVELLYKHETAS